MSYVVMFNDVLQIYGFFDSLHLVQLSRVRPRVRVVHDSLLVALKSCVHYVT